jgi:hypothetical protein
MENIEITLTDEEYDKFMGAISGDGGGQSLVRDLQDKFKTIELNNKECVQIKKYVDDYGNGGFQDRLKILKPYIKE